MHIVYGLNPRVTIAQMSEWAHMATQLDPLECSLAVNRIIEEKHTHAKHRLGYPRTVRIRRVQ